MRHAFAIAGLTLVGVVAGVAAVFVHASTARPGGVALPWGVVLALGGLVAILLFAQAVARSRVGKAFVAAGWLIPVFVGTQTRGSGDLLVPADGRGLTLLFGGVVIIGVALGVPATSPKDSRQADDVR